MTIEKKQPKHQKFKITSLCTVTASVSAALLAYTTCINSASAVSIIYDSGPGTRVLGINDLVVDGDTYNVEFFETSEYSYEEIWGSDFDFDTSDDAKAATQAVIEALAPEDWVAGINLWDTSGDFRRVYDTFRVPFSLNSSGSHVLHWSENSYLDVDGPISQFSREVDRKGGSIAPWAKFTLTGGGSSVTSVPEPSLVLGFITLGGLMVGSKRKARD